MNRQHLNLNDRVEYATMLTYGEAETRRMCVGYVKRIFRKWFTTYVEICEHKTRRVDCVKLKDVFGCVSRDEYRNKTNN